MFAGFNYMFFAYGAIAVGDGGADDDDGSDDDDASLSFYAFKATIHNSRKSKWLIAKCLRKEIYKHNNSNC